MNRFVDERDLEIKNSAGIILLDGVICAGTAEFGPCDRSCMHFWREEWLERIEQSPPAKAFSSMIRAEAGSVRVRSLKEIDATLDLNRRKEGCTFLPEMSEYCGTVQQIRGTLTQFVDERDLRARSAIEGIVLLAGVICRGGTVSGGCDRSCHLLWRREWLEYIPR